MHHRIGAVIDEQPLHRVAIVNRRGDEGNARRQRFAMAGRKIVKDRHGVAGAGECAHGVAADVSRAAGDNHPRHVSARSRNT